MNVLRKMFSCFGKQGDYPISDDDTTTQQYETPHPMIETTPPLIETTPHLIEPTHQQDETPPSYQVDRSLLEIEPPPYTSRVGLFPSQLPPYSENNDEVERLLAQQREAQERARILEEERRRIAKEQAKILEDKRIAKILEEERIARILKEKILIAEDKIASDRNKTIWAIRQQKAAEMGLNLNRRNLTDMRILVSLYRG